jgi:cob(I)alamin adenosyltransferase
MRLHAYGSIDEINAAIGCAVAEGVDPRIAKELTTIQATLFRIGADLASTKISHAIPRAEERDAEMLEQWIDGHARELKELRTFILPGGTKAAAALHLARTICRRAERWIVELAETEDVNPHIIIYMNRLSDYLFTIARAENQRAGSRDVEITLRPEVSGDTKN